MVCFMVTKVQKNKEQLKKNARNLISLEKKCIFAEKFLKMLRLYSFEIIYDPIKYYCSSF